MACISKSALVPYTPAEMFALVDDVDRYPEFLPWCSAARVLSRSDDEVCASISLSKSGIDKSFVTCNRNQKNKMIDIRLKEGPFKQLQGYWRFDALGEDGCKVSLNMEFEFSSRVLGMVVGPVFSQVANSLVDSFQKRAAEVYGRR